MSGNPITKLAEVLINDNEPIEGFAYTGSQYFHLAEKFLQIDINILEDYPFPDAYLQETGDRLFGWYCVVILQRRLYDNMLANHFGKASAVEYMCSYLYVVERKMNEKILANARKEPVKHMWIH